MHEDQRMVGNKDERIIVRDIDNSLDVILKFLPK